MRSASASASTGSWVTRIARAGESSEDLRRSWRRVSARVCTSSAASGSSSRSSFGSVARARASATRCAWPPDSVARPRRRLGLRRRLRPGGYRRERARRPDAGRARAVRTRRCRARSGARTAGSPGTPLRPSAVRAGRTARPRGRRRRRRRCRCGRRRAGAVRRGRATGWSCPNRSVRAPRASRRRRREGRRRGRTSPSATRTVASTLTAPRANGRAGSRARRARSRAAPG